jgi:hypothetical protein
VWVPESAEAIETAAQRGDLEETHTFDAKGELSPRKKNRDLAEDVAAMTVDGGVLVYGVDEDASGRPTIPKPIVLKGARERIDQIAQTSISEPPFIEIHEHPSDGDASRGYLVVVISPSPRAPHQVTSGGDLRFYGRGATGNRILTEGEVALLYQRRQTWEVDREALLREEVVRWLELGSGYGTMVAFARPVVRDDSFVDRAAPNSDELQLHLVRGAKSWGGGSYPEDLREAFFFARRGADGWTLSNDSDLEFATARLDLDHDGTGHLFSGRVADRLDSGKFVLFEDTIAGNLASFFAALGEVYAAAGYAGQVDVGVAVLHIEEAVSTHLRRAYRPPRFDADEYRRTSRVVTAELRQPQGVTMELLRRLLEAVAPSFNPFTSDEN